MPKIRINLSIDETVYKKHKQAGHNVSKLVNNFLEAYFNSNLNVLEQKKSLELKELIKGIKAVNQIETKDKELRLALNKALEYRPINPHKTNTILKAICEEYGLSWPEVVQRMESLK
jgi:hypothetical protein